MDKEGGELFASGALMAGGKIIGMLIQVILGLLIIRILSKNDYGLITLSYMLVSIISVFSLPGFEIGLPQLLINAKAHENNKKISQLLGSSLTISLLLTFIFVNAAIHYRYQISSLLNSPDLASIFIYFVAITPAMILLAYFSTISRWLKYTWPVVLYQDLAQFLFRLVMIILVVVFGYGIYGVVFSYVLSAFFALIFFSFWMIPKLRRYELKISYIAGKTLLIYSFPLFLIGICGLMTPWLVGFQLASLYSPEVVAMYSAPLRISALIGLPIQALSFLYIPTLTRLLVNNKYNEIIGLYNKSTKWLGITSMIIAILFCFDSDFFIELLIGEKYLDSKNILIVLCLSQWLHCSFGPNGQTLIALGNRKLVLLSNIIAIFFLLFGLYKLVPIYGALGSAISLFIYYFVINIVLSTILYFKIKVLPFNTNYFACIISLLIWSYLYELYITPVYGDFVLTHVLYTTFIFIWVIFVLMCTNGFTQSELSVIHKAWIKITN